MYPRDDGLGLSLLIYLAAMLCGLAVVAVPTYDALRPNVIRNASLQKFDRHEYRAAYGRFRLLHLKKQTIVTRKELAKVDAQEMQARLDARVTEAERNAKPRQAPVAQVAQRIPLPSPRELAHPSPPHNSLAEIGIYLGLPHLSDLF